MADEALWAELDRLSEDRPDWTYEDGVLRVWTVCRGIQRTGLREIHFMRPGALIHNCAFTTAPGEVVRGFEIPRPYWAGPAYGPIPPHCVAIGNYFARQGRSADG